MAKATTKAKTPAKRKPRAKKPHGRPSEFDQAIADKICDELTEGKSLRRICMADDMPSASGVFKWLRTNEDFVKQYALAREAQADTFADEICDIADHTELDTVKDGEGNERPNTEWITRSRLRVDARKWVASKLRPKKYGDKLDLTSQGEKIGLSDMIAEGRRRAEEGMGE